MTTQSAQLMLTAIQIDGLSPDDVLDLLIKKTPGYQQHSEHIIAMADWLIADGSIPASHLKTMIHADGIFDALDLIDAAAASELTYAEQFHQNPQPRLDEITDFILRLESYRHASL